MQHMCRHYPIQQQRIARATTADPASMTLIINALIARSHSSEDQHCLYSVLGTLECRCKLIVSRLDDFPVEES